METNNKAVDVLAVMDLAANNLKNLGCRGSGGDVDEARAAVAELIEAVNRGKRVINPNGQNSLYFSLDDAQAVFSAIARVGGGK